MPESEITVSLPREVATWLLFFVEHQDARDVSSEDGRRGSVAETRLREAINAVSR